MDEEWKKLKRREKIIREASKILRVREEDLVKTIVKFKKEIERVN
ncbi:MAG: hypothetical protein QXD89_01405 [Candidatus Aenigmatarchaeota archaeon]